MVFICKNDGEAITSLHKLFQKRTLQLALSWEGNGNAHTHKTIKTKATKAKTKQKTPTVSVEYIYKCACTILMQEENHTVLSMKQQLPKQFK